jgi:hypothetical protein
MKKELRFLFGVCGMELEGRIREKIGSLMQYREALDESERELFDILMGYANEVVTAIDCRAAGMDAQGC